MFIYIHLIKDNKYRKIVILLLVLVGIFLIFLIGTRVGLLGFILVLAIYIIVEVFYSLLHNEKINKKYVAIGGISIIIIGITVILFGSTTLQRRKHLKDIESDIIDESLKRLLWPPATIEAGA